MEIDYITVRQNTTRDSYETMKTPLSQRELRSITLRFLSSRLHDLLDVDFLNWSFRLLRQNWSPSEVRQQNLHSFPSLNRSSGIGIRRTGDTYSTSLGRYGIGRKRKEVHCHWVCGRRSGGH